MRIHDPKTFDGKRLVNESDLTPLASDLSNHTQNSNIHVTADEKGKIEKIDSLESRIEAVENGAIELDDTVTQSSANGVKSSGIYEFVQSEVESAKESVKSEVAETYETKENVLELSSRVDEIEPKVTANASDIALNSAYIKHINQNVFKTDHQIFLPNDTFNPNEGELRTISGFQFNATALLKDVPASFDTISFNDPRNTVICDTPIYAHLFFGEGDRIAVSKPVYGWREHEQLKFVFDSPIQKKEENFKFLLSTDAENPDARPNANQCLTIFRSTASNRPMLYFFDEHGARLTNMSVFDMSFYTDIIGDTKNRVNSLEEKIGELYPMCTQIGVYGADYSKPPTTQAVFDFVTSQESPQIQAALSAVMTQLMRHATDLKIPIGQLPQSLPTDALHVTQEQLDKLNAIEDLIVIEKKVTETSDTTGVAAARVIIFNRDKISNLTHLNKIDIPIPSPNNATHVGFSTYVQLGIIKNDGTKELTNKLEVVSSNSQYIGANTTVTFKFDTLIDLSSLEENETLALFFIKNNEEKITITNLNSESAKTELTNKCHLCAIYGTQANGDCDVFFGQWLSEKWQFKFNLIEETSHNAIDLIKQRITELEDLADDINLHESWIESIQDDLDNNFGPRITKLEKDVDLITPRTDATHKIGEGGNESENTSYRQIILNKKHLEGCEGITSISIKLAPYEPTTNNEFYLGVGKCELNGNISEIISYSKNKAQQYNGGTLDYEFDSFNIDKDVKYISLCLYSEQHESGFDRTDNFQEFNVQYNTLSDGDDSRIIKQEDSDNGIVEGLAIVTLNCKKKDTIANVIDSLNGSISEVDKKAESNKDEIERIDGDYQSLSGRVRELENHQDDDPYGETIKGLESKVEELDEKVPELEEKIGNLQEQAEGFATKNELSDYAKKTDIPSIAGLATESYVDDEIAKIEIPDVSDFITEDALEPYAKSEDLEKLAAKDELNAHTGNTDIHIEKTWKDGVDTKISALESKDCVSSETLNSTLSEYAKTEDLEDFVHSETLDDYVTNDALDSAIAESAEAVLNEKLDEKLGEKVSEQVATKIDELKEQFVTDEDISELQRAVEDATSKVNGFESTIEDLQSDISNTYATKEEIKDFITNEALEPYATTEQLEQHTQSSDLHLAESQRTDIAKISSIENTLSGLDNRFNAKADKTELTSLATKEDIKDFVTSSDLDGKLKEELFSYITYEDFMRQTEEFVSNDELENYATKTELNSVSESVSNLEGTVASKIDQSSLNGILEPYAKTETIEKTYATKESLNDYVTTTSFESALNEKADDSDLTSHTSNNNIHITNEWRESVNNDIKSLKDDSLKVGSELSSHVADSTVHFDAGQKLKYQEFFGDDVESTNLKSIVERIGNLEAGGSEEITIDQDWTEDSKNSQNAQSGIAVAKAVMEVLEDVVTDDDFAQWVEEHESELNDLQSEVTDLQSTVKEIEGSYVTSDSLNSLDKRVEFIENDYLTSNSLNGYAKTVDIETDYATKNELSVLQQSVDNKVDTTTFDSTIEGLDNIYTTEEYVDNAIEQIDIPSVTSTVIESDDTNAVSGFAVTAYVKNKLNDYIDYNELQNYKDEVENTYATKDNLSNYATKDELSTLRSSVASLEDIADFVTQSDIDNSIEDWANDEDIEGLKNKVKEIDTISENVSQIESSLSNKLESADLEPYAIKSEVEQTYAKKSDLDNVTITLDESVTESSKNAVTSEGIYDYIESRVKGFTFHTDIAGYDEVNDLLSDGTAKIVFDAKGTFTLINEFFVSNEYAKSIYAKKSDIPTITVDKTVTAGSGNAVSGNAVYNHVADHANNKTIHLTDKDRTAFDALVADYDKSYSVKSLMDQIATLTAQLTELRSYVDDNFIKGKVVTGEDNLPPESERKDGYNYFVIPTPPPSYDGA